MGRLVSKRRPEGFTLLEVLIAMAITAFVALIATTSLSRVMDGVESLRATADRTYDVNRAWMIISRDLRHLAERPVRDEFGADSSRRMPGANAGALCT